MEASSLYGQAGTAITFPSRPSIEVQSQAQAKGVSPYVSTYLPQPDQIPIETGTSHSQKADHSKHSKFVPTVIPFFQHAVELESLSEHCHTSEDLRKHQYLLRQYTDDDIAGLCRCENCGGDY